MDKTNDGVERIPLPVVVYKVFNNLFVLPKSATFIGHQVCLRMSDKRDVKTTSRMPRKLKRSQNCVEAAIAFVCTSCKRQLVFAILQLITFVCTSAI